MWNGSAKSDDRTRDQLIRERDLAESALEASEQLTRRILEAVPGGVVHVAADGAIQAANAEAAALLGLSYDELTRRYTSDFGTETLREDGTPFAHDDYPVSRALSTGKPQAAVTIGVRRPDGTLSWCVFRAFPVLDSRKGAVTGAVVTFLDVTARKQMEDAVRTSESALRALFVNAPSIIYTADLEGRLTFINRVAPGIAGVGTADDFFGQSIFAWLNERDHGRVRDAMKRVADRREMVEIELDGLDGVDPNCYLTRMGPVVRDDAVVAVAGAAQIITEQKRAEKERASLLAQLNEAQRLEAVGRLAGGVAHDFNNLLTVIQGGVDMLTPQVAGTSLAKRVEEIGRAADRAADLTRQLLAFGRRQALEPRPLDLGVVVADLEEMLRRLVGEHIELEVLAPAGLGVVLADAVALERVIFNLAANARDAMPQGGTLRITVREHLVRHDHVEPGVPAGSYLLVEVLDSGEGIDAATQRLIFEPFFSTRAGRGGTGLGLATVHGIVSQSGGYVTVRSQVGEGACFRLFLPQIDHPLQPAETPPEPAPAPARGTVLLVEDEAAVRRVAKEILEHAGYRVLQAANPMEVLESTEIDLDSIDVLVSDVVMPRKSGPELARELLRSHPRLVVLLMSGHVDDTVGTLPEDCAFLSKPFRARELVDRVDELMRGRGA